LVIWASRVAGELRSGGVCRRSKKRRESSLELRAAELMSET
jgi:hypothetical protein